MSEMVRGVDRQTGRADVYRVKILKYCIIPALLWPIGILAQEEMTTDKFGQTIPVSIHTIVEDAKRLRYSRDATEDDIEQSVQELQQVVDDNPDYYRAVYNLGLAKMKLKPDDPDFFLNTLKEAAKIEKSNQNIADGSIYNTIGWIELNNKNYTAAETWLNTAINSQASSDWTKSASHYNMGRIHFENQNLELAKRFLTISANKYGNPAAISLLDTVEKIEKIEKTVD